MTVAKMHFAFRDIGIAQQAMDAWNDAQREQHFDVSAFEARYDGAVADVTLADISMSVQDAFGAFLAQHFAGKHTVHDTLQTRSLFKDD